MLKKLLSLIISTAILTTIGIPLTAIAEVAEKNEEISILMNGERIFGDQNNEYIYTAQSLENLPVLSCSYDNSLYSALITQPTRDNGYKGFVTLTSLSDGTVTEHKINVYDNNTFKSHFINLGGDPWVTYHDGWYYYMVTGNAFYVSRSRELERVNSNPVSVFNMNDLVSEENNIGIVKELWAPELHFIDGHWYIYFTIYDGETEDETAWNGCTGRPANHRMYVLESETEDIYSTFTFKGQLKEVDEDYKNDAGWNNAEYNIKPGHWAIDQSIFKWKGKLYAVWSGWSGYTSVDQRIFIAEMSDPYTISSSRVELSRPNYAYETYSVIPAVNEGPQALISPDGSTLNIAFSANRFDDSTYSLGLLTLKKDGDPLNADDWTKTDKPVLQTNTEKSTYSVGHCSFVASPDKSEYYLIYHARGGENVATNPREIRIQQFYWYDNGTPCFEKPINAADLVQIPSGTAIIDRTELEAENAKLTGGAKSVSATDGTTAHPADYYSDGAHLILTTKGSAATFTYNAEKSGKYTVSLLASGSSSTISGFTVTVNGTEYTRKLGGNSSDIDNFYYYDLNNIDLKEGENTITVSHNGAFTRGGYLDRVDIWNEADADTAWETQDSKNSMSQKSAVIRPYTAEPLAQNPEYGKEYTFNDFGDFDKYWFSSEPFVDDPEYENVITTCRAGGNKRLFVSGREFSNIADFKSSVEIIPAAAHENAHNPSVPVKDETGINAGILFHIGEMLDYTSNVCSFDGYRCMLLASGSEVKLQLSRYYFKTESSTSSTNYEIKKTDSTLPYIPGDTYVIELSCIGNIVNATAYNKNDPNTAISIANQTIVTSIADTIDSGRIGLFVNCGSRVTFANMKVTPYLSSASLASDYGYLNCLDSYEQILPSTRSFSTTNGTINIPTGVSKLLVKDQAAQNIADFTAKARIGITQTSGGIQAGIAFRVGKALVVSSGKGLPGLSGYAIMLQKTSTHAANKIVINLTKYGTNSDGITTANLGNQSYSDTNLLSDITDKTAAYGLKFDFDITVIGNKMTVTVTRADKPSLSSTYNWVLDDPDYGMNKDYSVYYESGRIGTFSNGYASIENFEINKIPETEHSVNIKCQNGNAAANIQKSAVGKNIDLTLHAKDGFYINSNKITATLENGTTVNLMLSKTNWDTDAVYSFTMPDGAVDVDYEFSPITSGDSNKDTHTDVRDLIRTKKFLANLTDDIALSNTDADGNRAINSADLTVLRKQLLEK